MDRRDYYLTEIMRLHNINMLHIIRGAAITDQFGTGNLVEKLTGPVIREAFTTGQPVFLLNELTMRPTVRAIISYVASSKGNLNCLSCHNVAEGTVLGAVDIELDVTSYQRRSLIVLAGLFVASVIFLILIAINTSCTIQRHVQSPLEDLINNTKTA